MDWTKPSVPGRESKPDKQIIELFLGGNRETKNRETVNVSSLKKLPPDVIKIIQ